MFSVGQSIECIDARGSRLCLQNGRIYTCTAPMDEENCIKVNCCADHQQAGTGWFATRFRPLVERKTDISIFTALLNTKKMREPANG